MPLTNQYFTVGIAHLLMIWAGADKDHNLNLATLSFFLSSSLTEVPVQ